MGIKSKMKMKTYIHPSLTPRNDTTLLLFDRIRGRGDACESSSFRGLRYRLPTAIHI